MHFYFARIPNYHKYTCALNDNCLFTVVILTQDFTKNIMYFEIIICVKSNNITYSSDIDLIVKPPHSISPLP